MYLAQVICTGGSEGGMYVWALPSGPMKTIFGGEEALSWDEVGELLEFVWVVVDVVDWDWFELLFVVELVGCDVEIGVFEIFDSCVLGKEGKSFCVSVF